jgi:hypothetical protein|eukprot:COSAG06_NODE_223_length_19837_cov_114.095653_4_plen_108_part_00
MPRRESLRGVVADATPEPREGIARNHSQRVVRLRVEAVLVRGLHQLRHCAPRGWPNLVLVLVVLVLVVGGALLWLLQLLQGSVCLGLLQRFVSTWVGQPRRCEVRLC